MRRRKTGPRAGLYRKLFGTPDGKIPRPSKPWRKLSSLERSRIKEGRALWRRTNEAAKYQRFGRWVKGIRKRMELSQAKFARTLGVSKITIRRWELGYGYQPLRMHLKRLKELSEVYPK